MNRYIFIFLLLLASCTAHKEKSSIDSEILTSSNVHIFHHEDSIKFTGGNFSIDNPKFDMKADTIKIGYQLFVDYVLNSADTFIRFSRIQDKDTLIKFQMKLSFNNAQLFVNKPVIEGAKLSRLSSKHAHFVEFMGRLVSFYDYLLLGYRYSLMQDVYLTENYEYNSRNDSLIINCHDSNGSGRYIYTKNEISFQELANNNSRKSEESAIEDGLLKEDYIPMLLKNEYYSMSYFITRFNWRKNDKGFQYEFEIDGNKLIKESFMPIKKSKIYFETS